MKGKEIRNNLDFLLLLFLLGALGLLLSSYFEITQKLGQEARALWGGILLMFTFLNKEKN